MTPRGQNLREVGVMQVTNDTRTNTDAYGYHKDGAHDVTACMKRVDNWKRLKGIMQREGWTRTKEGLWHKVMEEDEWCEFEPLDPSLQRVAENRVHDTEQSIFRAEQVVARTGRIAPLPPQYYVQRAKDEQREKFEENCRKLFNLGPPY